MYLSSRYIWPYVPTVQIGAIYISPCKQRWFPCMYERCIASGLKARFMVRHVAGLQEASLTCSLSLPLPNITVPTTKRHRRRRMLATTDASGSDVPPPADAITPGETVPIQSLPPSAPPMMLPPPSEPEAPPTVTALSPTRATSPPVSPPPAKQTRKAAKWRCEVEPNTREGSCRCSLFACIPNHDPASEYRLRRFWCIHYPCCAADVGLLSFLSVQSYLPILSSRWSRCPIYIDNVQIAIKKRGGTNYHGW